MVRTPPPPQLRFVRENTETAFVRENTETERKTESDEISAAGARGTKATPMSDPTGRKTVYHHAASLGCASTACVVADTMCLPLDFVKVRMQLQNELLPANAPKASQLGVISMVRQIMRTEGPLAFYDGVGAAMVRQATYGGLCFSSYPTIRDALSSGPQDSSLAARLGAGAISGGLASGARFLSAILLRTAHLHP